MEDIYRDFSEVSQKIKNLTVLKEELSGKILDDMTSKKMDTQTNIFGKFTVSYLKKWKYPDNIISLEEEVKAKKAETQNSGEAIYTEEPSLRFTALKI